MIGLAPCHYYLDKFSYDEQRHRFMKLEQLGIYHYFGDDEAYFPWEICNQVSNYDCNTVYYSGYGYSIKTDMYFTQIAVAGQFQESIGLEEWVAGEIYSTPVNLSNIDRTPVSIVMPIKDEICDPDMIEWTYAQMQQEEKYLRFEHGGHGIFSLYSSDSYV